MLISRSITLLLAVGVPETQLAATACCFVIGGSPAGSDGGAAAIDMTLTRVQGVIALLARSGTTQEIEILLRHQLAVLQPRTPRHNGAGRTEPWSPPGRRPHPATSGLPGHRAAARYTSHGLALAPTARRLDSGSTFIARR
jgi:hypothetical protein